MGEVATARVFRNVGARPGDALILTKPLGSGIVTTAIKRGKARPAAVKSVTSVMATLNRAAGEVLSARYRSVHAVTDVTGFGLLGHLLEMLDGSDASAVIGASSLPILDAASQLAAQGVVPGGTRANLKAAGRKLKVDRGIDKNDPRILVLADAQTSGGLLAAVTRRAAGRIVEELRRASVQAHIIGHVEAGPPRVQLVPAI